MNPLSFSEAVDTLTLEPRAEREFIERCFDAILGGAWNNTQVAAFSLSLNLLGLSVPILVGAASRMRAHMVSLPGAPSNLLDTCGTGGDGSGSLNLSTGAAVLLAASGVRVAKHGNRAASSKSGSADVLEALGLPLDLAPGEEAELLAETGIVFLFAQAHHPALKPLAPARRELGVRTLWNCLGPLANPAGADIQLLGAYADGLRPLMAGALRELGGRKAWVVRSEDGMDELSPFASTRVTELRDGQLRELVVHPRDFGLEPSAPGAIDGGTAIDNAAALRAVLEGRPHPARNAFVLNAAAALALARDLPYPEATAQIQATLASGAAVDKLDAMVRGAEHLARKRLERPLSAAAGPGGAATETPARAEPARGAGS